MYGENGAAMRRELAGLLRHHRIQHRIGGPTQADREASGQQILQYRQNLLIWCTQAMQAANPLLFSNLPTAHGNPFRAGRPAPTGAEELARALQRAIARSSAHPASLEQLTTPSNNPVVEHWREIARAAALAEHDTAPDITAHLTSTQAQALVGDVAAVTQALVVLDQRYKNTPGWEHLGQSARLAWAALAAAVDVNLGQPDYTIDNTGWRPKTKLIHGPAKPGILGVLQAEHNLAVRLKFAPDATNLRGSSSPSACSHAIWSRSRRGSTTDSPKDGKPGLGRTPRSNDSCAISAEGSARAGLPSPKARAPSPDSGRSRTTLSSNHGSSAASRRSSPPSTVGSPTSSKTESRTGRW